MPTSIELVDVSFAYDDTPLFQHARASFGAGFTGLVGANGAGKSTLLRLLAGLLEPDEGAVRTTPNGARVLYVPQEDDDDAGGSPGERRIVTLERAVAERPPILLVDEPTNHLDEGARGRVLRLLRGYGGVGVVVSHDRAFLDELCARTASLLPDGGVRVDESPYSAAASTWAQERDAALAARDVARDEVKRRAHELARRRENERAAEKQRSTSARMRSRYDSDQRGLLAQGRADNGAAAHARRAHIGERELARAASALSAADAAVHRELGRAVAFAFEGATRAPPRIAFLERGPLAAGGRVLVDDLAAISIGRADRVHIDGRNGAGKTTLLRALLSRGLRVPQERVFFMPQEVDDVEDPAALPREERGRVLQLVAALGAAPERVMRSPRLSPGERKKLALAFALARGSWALFLDEPTNHLDLPSIERLQAALSAFPGALVLITHDRALARATTTSRVELGAGSQGVTNR